jgi:hypothetical protein
VSLILPDPGHAAAQENTAGIKVPHLSAYAGTTMEINRIA